MEQTGVMYKKPPADDEQREYPEFTYPARRRRRKATTNKQPSIGYHSDEHPEIPKIRRASLYLDEQNPQRSSWPALDEEIHENEDEQDRPPKAPDTSKIMVAVNRRSSSSRSYNPPSSIRQPYRSHRTLTHKSTRHVRSHHPFLSRLQQLSHNPAVMIIGIMALLLLITTPIIRNINHNHTTVTTSGESASTSQPPSAIGPAPANAHKLVITPQDTDHPPPPVLATSAYLLDADTGATLYAYNPFMHLPMLSTTKLMTALLAAQEGNPDQKITITPAITNDISQLSADSTLFGLKEGETYTLRELMYGLLLLSGNDAAIAIGDGLAGNLPNFVAQMNARAQQLGLHDTHYMNPHGLLEARHYSSARDLAILGAYALSKPLIHQISGTETYVVPQTSGHPEHDLVNGNQ